MLSWLLFPSAESGGEDQGMMEATQYRHRSDSARLRVVFLVESSGGALTDALMWSRVIVVTYEFGDEAT